MRHASSSQYALTSVLITVNFVASFMNNCGDDVLRHCTCLCFVQFNAYFVDMRFANQEYESLNFVCVTFEYGSECWAITKEDACRINAFYQWCLHMLLSIK